MSTITEFYGYAKQQRKHPIPDGLDYSRLSWAQLEAVLFDKPFPQ